MIKNSIKRTNKSVSGDRVSGYQFCCCYFYNKIRCHANCLMLPHMVSRCSEATRLSTTDSSNNCVPELSSNIPDCAQVPHDHWNYYHAVAFICLNRSAASSWYFAAFSRSRSRIRGSQAHATSSITMRFFAGCRTNRSGRDSNTTLWLVFFNKKTTEIFV